MSTTAALSSDIETIAELRELYRAAEARAARLRLLSATGRDLNEADTATFDACLQGCADRLAFFLGRTGARLSNEIAPNAIAVPGSGKAATAAGWLLIDGVSGIDAIADAEDRDTVRLSLEMLGAAIDRRARDADRALLLAALQEREQRLEWLVEKVFSAQETERRRVSQELHDGVAQTATALVRMLEGADPAKAAEISADRRAELAAIARNLVGDLRGVIGGLRPTLLDDLGLAEALRAMAESLAGDGYEVTITVPPAAPRLSATIETALFRVAQEALANIRKHSGGPCPVTITLAFDAADDRYLRIEDRGVGMAEPPPALTDGAPGQQVGLEIMRERMIAIGGRLEWSARPGGVVLTARVPAPS